jgi:hypothetical protein
VIAYAELDGQLTLFCQDFFEQSELGTGPVIIGTEGIHYVVAAGDNHFRFVIERLDVPQGSRETFGGMPVRVDMYVREMSEPDGTFGVFGEKTGFTGFGTHGKGVRGGQCQAGGGTC